MCTYRTDQLSVSGSAKGNQSWMRVRQAVVYFDHPQHAMHEHTLNIDLLDSERGPDARIAIELSPQSAAELCRTIESILQGAAELGLHPLRDVPGRDLCQHPVM